MQDLQHQVHPVHPPEAASPPTQQQGPPLPLPALQPGLLSPLHHAHSPAQLLPARLQRRRQREHAGDGAALRRQPGGRHANRGADIPAGGGGGGALDGPYLGGRGKGGPEGGHRLAESPHNGYQRILRTAGPVVPAQSSGALSGEGKCCSSPQTANGEGRRTIRIN